MPGLVIPLSSPSRAVRSTSAGFFFGSSASLKVRFSTMPVSVGGGSMVADDRSLAGVGIQEGKAGQHPCVYKAVMSDDEIALEGRAPRFNYMSTEDRRDMVAVLEAFIARNSEAEAIDRAIDEPPAGRA